MHFGYMFTLGIDSNEEVLKYVDKLIKHTASLLPPLDSLSDSPIVVGFLG